MKRALLLISHLNVSFFKCTRVILEILQGLAAELFHVPVFHPYNTTLIRFSKSIRLSVSANYVVKLFLILDRFRNTLVHFFKVRPLILTQLAQVYPMVVLN